MLVKKNIINNKFLNKLDYLYYIQNIKIRFIIKLKVLLYFGIFNSLNSTIFIILSLKKILLAQFKHYLVII